MTKIRASFLRLLLILTTFAVYAPALGGAPVWDDDVHVFANPDMGSAEGLQRIWTSERAYYYPFTSTVFWILYQNFGNETFPYHLLNVLIHIANALLFWWILKSAVIPESHFVIPAKAGIQNSGSPIKNFGDDNWTFLAAFLFALHPVHVESVAWIAELKNLLACFFFLLSIQSFLAWGKFPYAYAGSVCFFVLSLLSKPAAAAFPLVIPLYFWWRNRADTPQSARLLRPLRGLTMTGLLLPFFLLSGLAALWTIAEQSGHSGASGEPWALSFVERLLIAGRGFWFYLAKLLWPHPLSFIYARWKIDSAEWLSYGWPLAAAVFFLLLVLIKKDFARNLLFALGFYFAMLFPILGFFNVYFFRYSFVADHFQYIASLAPLALLGFYLGKWRISFLLVPILGFLTWTGSARFRDLETLWRETIRTSPSAWLAHNNFGNILMKRGEDAAALPHYEEAVRHHPDFAEAHSNLAVALMNFKRYDEAIQHLEQALHLEPDSAEFHNNLGTAYTDLGRSEEAVRQYREALRLKPNFALAQHNLAHELRKRT